MLNQSTFRSTIVSSKPTPPFAPLAYKYPHQKPAAFTSSYTPIIPFTDGRNYSNARLLRDRYGYKGELRAIGDVLRDQLFYLHRCGFDAYALRADKDPYEALESLKDFSVTYQAATDEPLPLFRRR